MITRQRQADFLLSRALLLLLTCLAVISAKAQPAAVQTVAPGVWFLLGDSSKGYSNTVVIELRHYLIVVDANYPGRARELIKLMPTLSPKPVKYVFDTHAHGDHSYGNSTWTRAGATTVAFAGVVADMDRYEPGRWQAAQAKRPDLQTLNEPTVERPRLILKGNRFVLKDGSREVDFLFLGWAHTPGDGFVWLPHERILATGDAAVNGPRNKLWDAWIEHWPRVLATALALAPKSVLPGHGNAGGPEILTGQSRFLTDLYTAVSAEVAAGKPLAAIHPELPAADANWIPKDLSGDVEATYNEITARAPAGSLPHTWR